MPESTAAYFLNGQAVSAQNFYARACDPRRSLAVEACAGAGKTWLLVSRIVRALLEGMDPQTGELGVQPQEILAITFTRRAAAEMRDRVNQLLSELAKADEATLVEALQQRGLNLEKGSQAARIQASLLSNLYQKLLQSGRQVQVRTFHGWFAALLKHAPLTVLQSLGLPPRYELLEDDAQAIALVWRRFHAALLDDSEPNKALRQDYEHLVMEFGRSQTMKALQQGLSKRGEFELADRHSVPQVSVRRFDEEFPEFAGLSHPEDLVWQPPGLALFWQVAGCLGRANAKIAVNAGIALERSLTDRHLEGVIAALMTKEGAARKFSEKTAGIEQVRMAQDLVRRVKEATHQHAAWQYQQRMTRLLRLLVAEFAELKRERGWVDMNDVERAAHTMLSHPVLSGWVQERLDARVRHLMIDEFQDTSPLQWQALSAWLGSYAGAGSAAPSVFIVGDPKQSIYRFRRAEPRVFMAAQAFIRDSLGGDLLSCDHTRRNAQQVMALVNEVLGAARERDSYLGFRPHTTAAEAEGTVLSLPVIARPDAGTKAETSPAGWRDSLTQAREMPEETLLVREADQAARWIAARLADVQGEPALKPADIMVLSRRRAGLLPLYEALGALGIDAQIGEKTALIDCPEVQDVVALLDVLVSPRHNLSLARVLKSPLVGLGDEALVQIALLARQQSLPWLELLPTLGLKHPDGRELSEVLSLWRARLETLPPHDALQAIYDDADVLARFAAAAPSRRRDAVLANLQSLLAVSLALDGGRYATPYAFVRALKAGGVQAPATVNAQAVRLLTIHGAKGLEADVVVLLDTDRLERNAETMTVLMDWPGEESCPRQFVFLASESRPPSSAVATLEVERFERRREELNALYVALTRARHTLVVSSIEPHRTTQESWWQRIHHLVPESGRVAPPPRVNAGMPNSGNFWLPILPPALVSYGSIAIKIEEPEPVDAALDLLARQGQAMHRLLQWRSLDAPQVAAAGREFGLDAGQSARAAEMAQAILQGQGAWAWDPAVTAFSADELELCYRGRLLRLDRLVQRKDSGHQGEWWVLDYKSSPRPQTQPALVAQLAEYRDAVQMVYPADPVKAAFLTANGALVMIDSSEEGAG
jgi:ATP-dependent helicase/nuclease subunit A